MCRPNRDGGGALRGCSTRFCTSTRSGSRSWGKSHKFALHPSQPVEEERTGRFVAHDTPESGPRGIKGNPSVLSRRFIRPSSCLWTYFLKRTLLRWTTLPRSLDYTSLAFV
ncbi:hypothetical protein SKAU_G00302040 [Synaphobranchus kaupii]|uniref:Uncharacterized protein n=1 Tax=Synaphobranchus kaupii TaxID=118154 RepID=A0A9Q1EVT6_SYNKA|nr:hypothetical protein SKAU_G00302040 [Synaphobranchus kaupii]